MGIKAKLYSGSCCIYCFRAHSYGQDPKSEPSGLFARGSQCVRSKYKGRAGFHGGAHTEACLQLGTVLSIYAIAKFPIGNSHRYIVIFETDNVSLAVLQETVL